MTYRRCEICLGSKVIRLPIHRPASVVSPITEETTTLERSWREFPCPECSPTTSENRVRVLEYHSLISADERLRGDPDFANYARRSIADNLAHELFEDGFVTFREGPHDVQLMQYELIGTVGVVAPKIVASMEERIAQRQDQVAKGVVEEAIKQINNWGSYYGRQTISKEQAIDSVQNAFKWVMNKRTTKV